MSCLSPSVCYISYSDAPLCGHNQIKGSCWYCNIEHKLECIDNINTAFNVARIEWNNHATERLKKLEEDIKRITEDNMKVGRKPHRCPICDGEGKLIINNNEVLLSYPIQYKTKNCHVCKGEGVLWK